MCLHLLIHAFSWPLSCFQLVDHKILTHWSLRGLRSEPDVSLQRVILVNHPQYTYKTYLKRVPTGHGIEVSQFPGLESHGI